MPDAHVLLVYDSRHGHTFHVAEALERGLGKVPHVLAARRSYAEVTPDDLDRAHLIVVGGPTEGFSASSHIRKMFRRIGAYALEGKYGFAFDTHASGPLRGSAARFIEKQLSAMGVRFLEARRSAIVVDRPGDEPGSDRLTLEAGAEARFEALGEELGRLLVQALAEHPPIRSGGPPIAPT